MDLNSMLEHNSTQKQENQQQQKSALASVFELKKKNTILYEQKYTKPRMQLSI